MWIFSVAGKKKFFLDFNKYFFSFRLKKKKKTQNKVEINLDHIFNVWKKVIPIFKCIFNIRVAKEIKSWIYTEIWGRETGSSEGTHSDCALRGDGWR